jgi:hypothetical protein
MAGLTATSFDDYPLTSFAKRYVRGGKVLLTDAELSKQVAATLTRR